MKKFAELTPDALTILAAMRDDHTAAHGYRTAADLKAVDANDVRRDLYRATLAYGAPESLRALTFKHMLGIATGALPADSI